MIAVAVIAVVAVLLLLGWSLSRVAADADRRADEIAKRETLR